MENLNIPEVEPPPASPDAINFTVHLQRGEMGFGFRIIGGQEEGTQVGRGGDKCCYVERLKDKREIIPRVVSQTGSFPVDFLSSVIA